MKLIESLREKAHKASLVCGNKLGAPPELHEYWDALMNEMEPEHFVAICDAINALKRMLVLYDTGNGVGSVGSARAALAKLDALEQP